MKKILFLCTFLPSFVFSLPVCAGENILKAEIVGEAVSPHVAYPVSGEGALKTEVNENLSSLNDDILKSEVVWDNSSVVVEKYFGPQSKAPRTEASLARKIHKVGGGVERPDLHIGNDELSFAGGKKATGDALVGPPRRATFPGKHHTLSQIDEKKPPQLNVNYKLDESVSAKLAINEQDLSSPTYTPIKQENGVNAAGVYLDMDVNERVEVLVGGEVRSNETNSIASEDKSSQGARVGLKWSF